MSDFRHDPLNDQWISIANNRFDRPMEYRAVDKTVGKIVCPFCKGNESETPLALAAYRNDGSQQENGASPDWTARVVNNKFPSFSLHDVVEEASPPSAADDQFVSENLKGAQELVIPTSRHVSSLSELNKEELLLAFRVFQDRIDHFKSLTLVKHAMLFLNCGSRAGASLSHIHFQLIGSPVLSRFLSDRTQRKQQHASENGCSMLETLMDKEMGAKVRVIEQTENFCVVCPFASRFAFQVWIVPRKQTSDFSQCSQEMRDELAGLCKKMTLRMESVLDNPSYNLLLHLDPFQRSSEEVSEHSHWYVEIFPRLTRAAGFEWGTDVWVNPVSPESAAEQLRSI